MISKILNDLIREWMQSHVCYECEGDISKKNINILVKGILNLYDDKEGLENMKRENELSALGILVLKGNLNT